MPRFWAYYNILILSSKPPRCKHFLPVLPMEWQVKCIRKSYKGSGLARDTPFRLLTAFASTFPKGDGFWQCRKVARHHESRPLGEGGLTQSGKTEGVSLQQKSRRTKSAAALRGVTSQPALRDDPPHTGQIDPTQQMLQYDQHGILLSDRPFQPNSPFSKKKQKQLRQAAAAQKGRAAAQGLETWKVCSFRFFPSRLLPGAGLPYIRTSPPQDCKYHGGKYWEESIQIVSIAQGQHPRPLSRRCAMPDSPFCRCATSSPAGDVGPQSGSPWQSTQTSSLCQGLSLWERCHRR